jgi:hypothetical protein
MANILVRMFLLLGTIISVMYSAAYIATDDTIKAIVFIALSFGFSYRFCLGGKD